MRYFRMVFRSLLFLATFLVLDYVLPQHDIARITGTSIIPTTVGRFNGMFYSQVDAGNPNSATRSLRLINTEKKDTFLLGFIPRDKTSVMVYRNEDTGWIWPPYFKFDSSDLQAQADANVSQSDPPKWVVITHYGWRNRFFSIYPNAIAIRPIDDPNITIIPWFNIFFLTFLLIAVLFLRRAWFQFRERMIEPAVEEIGNRMDEVSAGVAERRGRLRRWFGGK
ncbi:MAG: DUF1523 family protein [Limimaricola sp.]|uniref:DUF1523 family protein n=1 Tax=Limimaricola sp. TaxID=2211665 RepID=UPI001DCA2599|nr:DUF1523 family protein [Limimaricola sp.]MBI1417643.1 DUF1523 family protein [Limimaricola sp.]